MSIVVADGCAKWYGQVLGIADISWTLRGGVVGLLGPNGAGKSTLIKLMAGLIRPSRGSLTVFGASPFASTEVRARIGYAPEHEQTYDELTGLELVTALGSLSGLSRADAKREAKAALEVMGMTAAMNRRVRGYSKGMRQRTKLASVLVHDPDFILLDEPLTGVDPIARNAILDRIKALGAAGKTVVVSSHVLYEIEAITEEILVIYRGQVLAEGNLYGIRRLIDKHPHRIRVECDAPRRLAGPLAVEDHVQRLSIERDALVIETASPDRCYARIGELVQDLAVDVRAMTSPDNNLAAVFDYLTGDVGGGRS